MRPLHLFVILFLLVSCQFGDQLDYTGDVPPSRWVVYAYIEADSFPRVQIQKSRTYTDNTLLDTLLPGEGTLYINDTLAGDLRPLTPGVYTVPVRPRSGQRVTIRLRGHGLPDAEGETIVCSPFPSIRVDTSSRGDGYLYLTLHLRDDGLPNDYYRLLLRLSTTVTDLTWKGNTPSIGTSTSVSSDVDVLDTDLFDYIPSSILGKDRELNPYHLFTNASFRGGERTVTLRLPYPRPLVEERYSTFYRDTLRYTYRLSHTLSLRVLRLTPDLYRFLHTLGTRERQPALYKEPVNLHTNVRDGLGIVGSLYTCEVTFHFSD